MSHGRSKPKNCRIIPKLDEMDNSFASVWIEKQISSVWPYRLSEMPCFIFKYGLALKILLCAC